MQLRPDEARPSLASVRAEVLESVFILRFAVQPLAGVPGICGAQRDGSDRHCEESGTKDARHVDADVWEGACSARTSRLKRGMFRSTVRKRWHATRQ